MATTKATRADVHQSVTTAIIKMLETAQANGATFPWCKPGVAHLRPTNATTNQRYRGINVMTLWGAADAANYRSGIWATLKQWNDIGATVRRASAAHRSCSTSRWTSRTRATPRPAASRQRKTIRMAKGYWVFNADQVAGFELPDLPTVDLTTRIEAAETFVDGLKLDIRHGGTSAFYQPSGDFVQMPERVLFQNTQTSTATEGYYGVLLHEIGHASGSSKRVGRDLTGRFGSASYAMEEIVAEWISGLLCADLGVTAQPRADHAHYIANWLTVLRNDKGAAMAAAAKASQAVEWMWAQVERQVQAA